MYSKIFRILEAVIKDLKIFILIANFRRRVAKFIYSVNNIVISYIKKREVNKTKLWFFVERNINIYFENLEVDSSSRSTDVFL